MRQFDKSPQNKIRMQCNFTTFVVATPSERFNQTLTGLDRREGLRSIRNPSWPGLLLIGDEMEEEEDPGSKTGIGALGEDRIFSMEF